MYVHDLRLSRIRTFESAALTFQAPDSKDQGPGLNNVTLVVGTNGAGKSTVLRSIALTAIAPVLSSSGFVARSIARRTKRGSSKGVMDATFTFTADDVGAKGRWKSTVEVMPPRSGWIDRLASTEAPSWSETLWESGSTGFFVVGYGATRRVESSRSMGSFAQEKERHPRFLRVASLFEDSVVLRPLSSWLPTWRNPGRRKQVIGLLNEIVGSAKLVDDPGTDDSLFDVGGSRVPFDALSDGYRAFIGWVADFLFHVTRGVPSGHKLNETAGIALVDEIDLHMHPQWQREVLPRLAAALPRMQFICTTHSPLVIGSVHQKNVLVLRDDDGESIVEPAPIEVHGLSSDQILTSPYFGLESTRAPAFVERLDEVAKQARAGDADLARQYLRMLSLGERAVESPKKRTKVRK